MDMRRMNLIAGMVMLVAATAGGGGLLDAISTKDAKIERLEEQAAALSSRLAALEAASTRETGSAPFALQQTETLDLYCPSGSIVGAFAVRELYGGYKATLEWGVMQGGMQGLGGAISLQDCVATNPNVSPGGSTGAAAPPTPQPQPTTAPQPTPTQANVARITVQIMDGGQLLGGACLLVTGLGSGFSVCDGDQEDLDPEMGRITFEAERTGSYQVSELSPPEGYARSSEVVSISGGTTDAVVTIEHDN